ncbi:MAG: hypothetical protein K9L66_06275 [Spirochaetaceae bacterium]|nr:hypothetical protein [Spirochaetaceae bacterium]MCF7949351.1 hypothetical protein [Spirochaetia bacterium]
MKLFKSDTVINRIKTIIKLILFYPKTCINSSIIAYREVRSNSFTAFAVKNDYDKAFCKDLYTRIYADILCTHKAKSLLKIGLFSTKIQRRLDNDKLLTAPLLDMWSEFLTGAKVFGFDNKDFSMAKGK